MRLIPGLFRHLLPCIITVVLAGCGGSSAPTTFFILSPLAKPSVADIKHDPFSVLVGPVLIAAYLDRDQIVSFQSGNQVVIDDFNHWAEPLADNMKRVLIENLSLLLPSSDIYDVDHRNSGLSDYQVKVEINRFDVTVNGSAIMVAFWSVHDKNSTQLIRKKSVLQADALQTGPRAQVEAQNRIVTDFSKEIAETLVSIQKKI